MLLQAPEQRAQARNGLDAVERAGWERQPDAAAIQGAVDVVGIEAVERDRAPHAEGAAHRKRPVVVGIDQGDRLLAWKRLDAQWA